MMIVLTRSVIAFFILAIFPVISDNFAYSEGGGGIQVSPLGEDEAEEKCLSFKIMLSEGARNNKKTSLARAISNQNYSNMRDAIWAGNSPDEFKGTALYEGAMAEYNTILLYLSILNDDLSAVSSILKSNIVKINEDPEFDDLMTPLNTAVVCASYNIVKIILESGADVNWPSRYFTSQGAIEGSRAIHWAARRGEINILKLLMLSGADPNLSEVSVDMNGNKKEWQSPINGDGVGVAALIYLLDNGANPNSQNWLGMTPLMYAAQEGNEEKCRILINHGTKKDIVNIYGFTASKIASMRGNSKISSIIDQ